MIFLTVGSALPFDRLVQMVDGVLPSLQLHEPVFAQIGRGRYRPKHFEYVDFLPKTEFDKAFDEASLVISHAGIGTIGIALRTGKPILVMPKMAVYGEHRNEHQTATAKRMMALGNVNVAFDEIELRAKLDRIDEIQGREPIEVHASGGLVEGIREFIFHGWNENCR